MAVGAQQHDSWAGGIRGEGATSGPSPARGMRERDSHSAPYGLVGDIMTQGSGPGSGTAQHACGAGEGDRDGPGETRDCDPEEWEKREVQQRPPLALKSAAGKTKDGDDLQEAPDGGWGWVVLVATIVVLGLTLPLPTCIGVFYRDLQNEFHASNTETSWVPSIMIAVQHGGGPLCSLLVERYGCRPTVMLGGVICGLGMAAGSFARTVTQLYITAGFITGLGCCFSFQPAVTILGHYFVRRRAFANAMSSTGTALGLCFLPLLANFLLVQLGWRGSFLVLAGVLLNCSVCGAVMRPLGDCGRRGHGDRPDCRPSPRNAGGLKGGLRTALEGLTAFLRQHMAFDLFLSDRRYRAFVLGVAWMMLGFVVPLVYLVPYAGTRGVEPGQAAMLLSALGAVNLFTRPLTGLLLGLPYLQGRPRAYAYAFCLALLANGLSNCMCGAAAGFPALLAYALVFGLSMSGVGSLVFTVLMDIVGMSRFPAALGLLTAMESLTQLLGPPLAGMLVDGTGQYTYVFYACSASVTSASLFLMGSFYWLDRERGREDKQASPPSRPSSAPSLGCQDCSTPTGGRVHLEREEFMYVTSV